MVLRERNPRRQTGVDAGLEQGVGQRLTASLEFELGGPGIGTDTVDRPFGRADDPAIPGVGVDRRDALGADRGVDLVRVVGLEGPRFARYRDERRRFGLF